MYKVTLINGDKETVIHHPNFNFLKVASGEILERVNVAKSFRFGILPFNPGYNSIHLLKTLVIVENIKTGKIEFDGRVLKPIETMTSEGHISKSYFCEDELGYLNDSCQRHGEYRNLTVRQFLEVIIENHNRDVAGDDIDKTFVVGEVTITNSTDNVYRYLGYDNTLETIFDKLIDRLGGEIRVRKENGVRYLDYLEEVSEVKSTEIRLAKNLKSIEKEVDPGQVITKLIPLGERVESEDEQAIDASQARLTIASVNNGKDYIEDKNAKSEFGIVTKSVTWDDITLPSNLLTRGQQFLHENNRVKVKHIIKALDLSVIKIDTDSFEVGNYHPVINPIMGINEVLRIVEKITNILKPSENQIVVGDLFKTASQYQTEANKSSQKVIELQNTVLRQSQSINSLKTELSSVDNAIDSINVILDENDIPALEQAVQDLNDAITNLNNAIEQIPDYGLATQSEDGLMSSQDKTKLDGLETYSLATETTDGLMSSVDKTQLAQVIQKLDLILVENPIDLDNIIARIEALENA